MDQKKSNILTRIRNALEVATPVPTVPNGVIHDVYTMQSGSLVESFRCAFEAIQGQFFYCTDKDDLLLRLTALLQQREMSGKIGCLSRLLSDSYTSEELHPITQMASPRGYGARVGITDCECLMARTGTILMSSRQLSGRVFPVHVPTHIVLATTSQLVYDLEDALRDMEAQIDGHEPSAWYFISGPSRTGDIEKTLVLGVHGPVEVIVFLMDDSRKQ